MVTKIQIIRIKIKRTLKKTSRVLTQKEIILIKMETVRKKN